MTDAPYSGQPYSDQRPLGSGMAVAALVLGILAVVFCWTVIGGVLFGLVAIVLGVVASRRARRGAAAGRGMAIAGIVLGVIGLLLSIALIAFGLSILNSPDAKTLKQCVADAGGDQAKVQQCQRDFQRNVQN
jgi:lysylphosphatidylglycerol synthetase-like protein (DUF2156 family)